MHRAVIHAPGDVRFEQCADPEIIDPTDAVIRTAASCVCGSDLWDYRGLNPIPEPWAIGHEYIGVVEEVGDQVSTIRPGQFVIGSFYASDNTCPHCRNGYQTACVRKVPMGGCQAEYVRVPLADGTLIATPEQPPDEMIPDLMALSDVMGTGWHAASVAGARPGATVVVIGDGAVGLCGVLAAAQLGAERVIAKIWQEPRAKIALDFGATDIVTERGDEGVEHIRELTGGTGADAVLECVGTSEAWLQALRLTRPGGNMGCVGLPHGLTIPVEELFYSHVALRGGSAPVRAYLPDLLERVWDGRIHPGRVFDLTLPLNQVAEAYRAMDGYQAIKVLLRP